jgi:GrpB-like predicted nucleotidyltransferase (UPF0157 family)
MNMDVPNERILRAVQGEYSIVPYDPQWPELFRRERDYLLEFLPSDLVRRIEHFGSTAVPGLAAKPIIDILVEVSDLAATRARIVPILVSNGYEYFWHPTHGDDGPPYYAWFIKRDAQRTRTHHIHMVEPGFREHWDRLLFRDYLIAHPDVAQEYQRLKQHLASTHPRDRAAYTNGKTEFITALMPRARSG